VADLCPWNNWQGERSSGTVRKNHSKHIIKLHGEAIISVNKAVVTQASSAIPVASLDNSILFKIMK
jgi:trans-2-enoyl-CoA reductase